MICPAKGRAHILTRGVAVAAGGLCQPGEMSCAGRGRCNPPARKPFLGLGCLQHPPVRPGVINAHLCEQGLAETGVAANSVEGVSA